MKTATLFALFTTVLLLVYQFFFFLFITFRLFNTFWQQLNYRAMQGTITFLFLLLAASLSYFFFVLYKNQKS